MTDLGAEAGRKPGVDRKIKAVTPAAAIDGWPIAFDGHAGWLHVPAGEAAGDVGVVICAPLGRDARCAHRPLRRLAQGLAAAGVPTLRYDHRGTGDSLAPPAGAEDLLPVWRDGLESAVRGLRDQAGIKRVVLVGLRFGAALVALSADLADGVVLLAPIVRGASWLRELRLATAVLAPTTGGATEGRQGLDADGLVLTPATTDAISRIDLRGLDLGVRPVLLAAQNSSVAAFGESSALAGARVAVEPFAGFEALFEDSHSNQAPDVLFARVISWIGEAFPRGATRGAAIPRPSPEEARLFPLGAVERPVEFGAGLRGVLCAPVEPGDRRADRAVIFCNTGGDPRAGIGGFATGAARALARAGVVSLRFDFAGLGDSDAPPDAEADGHIYETPRTPDFDGAVSLLASEGVRNPVVAGVCAGGYHALHAALDDPRIAGVLAVNTVILAWREGTSLAVGKRDQGRSTQAYLQRLQQWETWKRLLNGDLDIAAVARTLQRRLAALQQARAADAPEAAVKARLAAMGARGGQVRMVVGQDDPALDMVTAHFGRGDDLDAIPGLSLRIVPGMDHGLALQASRDLAQGELLAFVAEI